MRRELGCETVRAGDIRVKQRDMFPGSAASRSAKPAGASGRSERLGDALCGQLMATRFSELTDESGLRRRTGGAPLRRPVEWTRRIGGRAGKSAFEIGSHSCKADITRDDDVFAGRQRPADG